MRILNLLLLSLGILVVASACQRENNSSDDKQSVNAIIGDQSFVAAFDQLPDENTDEQLRLSTHLKYVERLLRSKSVDHLSNELRNAREKMLNLLNEYTSAADYPKNFDYPDQRIPCFIDRTGSICAVGYLIEQTAGPEVAQAINNKYQYDLIMEMDDPAVDGWIAQSGLTKEECAMIQPSYWGTPTYQDNSVGPGYAISSSALTGLNLTLTVTNSIQMLNSNQKKIVPYLGLATGAGQIALGIGIYPRKYNNTNIISSGDQIFSGINIGLGTATMAMSALNLLLNKKPQNNDLSWNVYSFQTPDQQAGIGLYVSKRF